jgi:hypothetical protein
MLAGSPFYRFRPPERQMPTLWDQGLSNREDMWGAIHLLPGAGGPPFRLLEK